MYYLQRHISKRRVKGALSTFSNSPALRQWYVQLSHSLSCCRTMMVDSSSFRVTLCTVVLTNSSLKLWRRKKKRYLHTNIFKISLIFPAFRPRISSSGVMIGSRVLTVVVSPSDALLLVKHRFILQKFTNISITIYFMPYSDRIPLFMAQLPWHLLNAAPFGYGSNCRNSH